MKNVSGMNENCCKNQQAYTYPKITFFDILAYFLVRYLYHSKFFNMELEIQLNIVLDTKHNASK